MLSTTNLQDWLKVSGDATLLRALEARAVAFLEAQTGRYFGTPAATVEILDGWGDEVLFLQEKVDESQAVTVEVNNGTSWVAEDAADYSIASPHKASARGRIYLTNGDVFPEGVRNVRVSYSRGYAPANDPDDGELDGPGDIVQATLDLVALKYRQRGEEGHSSAGIGGFSYSLADLDSIPGLRETLDEWRGVSL